MVTGRASHYGAAVDVRSLGHCKEQHSIRAGQQFERELRFSPFSPSLRGNPKLARRRIVSTVGDELVHPFGQCGQRHGAKCEYRIVEFPLIEG